MILYKLRGPGRTVAACVAAASIPGAPVAANPDAPPSVVGAWRLVAIDEIGPDGRAIHRADLKGSLIYTASGRLSVEVLYPDAGVDDAYVSRGYEASFGRYTLDPAARRIVHHVEGANVRALIGRDLPRTYAITGDRLVIGPVSPDEHWRVTWQRQ